MPLGRARIGRPGLIGTMARTAVISGTATAVTGRVARRQAARAQAEASPAPTDWDAQQQWAAAAAPPSAAAHDDTIEQLKELASLRDQGVLTDAEFDDQKARILGR